MLRPLRRRLAASVAFTALAVGCSPELVVGKVEQEKDLCLEFGAGGEGGAPPLEDKTVESSWSTGFEDGFCDYERALGLCYANGDAAYTLVTTPVHQGKYAAGFRVNANTPPDGNQTRCYLEGLFPTEAIYGAWYYFPEVLQNRNNWNLMYIKDATTPGGLWDVSVHNGDDGNLYLHIYGHITALPPYDDMVPLPIGEWVHIEFRVRFANDATGMVALRQNGVLVHSATGIVTDRYEYHQWYVGNWADDLTPSDSILYVDDVTISAPP